MGFDLDVDQGATLNVEFVWEQYIDDVDGTVTNPDLTGWTGRMQVRETPEATAFLLEFTTENGSIIFGDAQGSITLFKSAEAMELVPAGYYYYDLEVVDPNGIVYLLLAGRFTVNRNITR